jgi:hypothetical protein
MPYASSSRRMPRPPGAPPSVRRQVLSAWYGPSSVSSASFHATVASFQLPKCACTSPSSFSAIIRCAFSSRFFSNSMATPYSLGSFR